MKIYSTWLHADINSMTYILSLLFSTYALGQKLLN